MGLQDDDAKRKLVNSLSGKVSASAFPNYLKSIKIEDLKQLKNVEIKFDFPVTGISGRNGAGKTTILACAASAYSDSNKAVPGRHRYYINLLLPRTRWDKVRGKIQYTYSINNKDEITEMKCSKKRWRYPTQPTRQVRYFGNTRLVPKTEIRQFVRFQSDRFSSKIGKQVPLRVVTVLNNILGTDFVNIRGVKRYNTELFIGKKGKGKRISEFHWGAGESNLLLMLMEIESLPSGSLLLIDEIENALHPEALSRFIRHLINKAAEMNLQTIFTTHSKTAFDALPPNGRWFLDLRQNEVAPIQNIHSEYAFAILSGERTGEIQILVEDDVSAGLLIEILNVHDPVIRGRVEIRRIGDKNSVLAAHKFARQLGHKTIALIDGEANLKTDIANAYRGVEALEITQLSSTILQLPTGTPEQLLLQALTTKTKEFEQIFERNGELQIAIKKYAAVSPKDFLHDLALDLNVPYVAIVNSACRIWVRDNKDQTGPLFKQIKDTLDKS